MTASTVRSIASPPPNRRLMRRALQLGAVMAISAGLAYASSAAFATHAARTPVRPLASVFSVLRRAHRADAATTLREPIAGATTTVFASAFSNGDSVYVATLATGDICVVDQEPAGAAGQAPTATTGLIAVACAHAAEAEQDGASILTRDDSGAGARITLLVPDSVHTVTFHLSDGATVAQTPVNDVAQYSAPSLASASFVAPSGAGVSEEVPSSSSAPSS
jgi:hypothetical protein